MVTTPCELEGRREYSKHGIYDVLSKLSNTRSIHFTILSESVVLYFGVQGFTSYMGIRKHLEDARLDHFQSPRGMDKTDRD